MSSAPAPGISRLMNALAALDDVLAEEIVAAEEPELLAVVGDDHDAAPARRA